MSHNFVPLAERITDALLESDPVLAYHAGDHRADNLLPDWSAEGVRSQAAMLHEAADALAEVDLDDLDGEEEVDHALLARLVDRRLFELQDVRAYEWNPLLHNPGPLLDGLLTRPFAPLAERLESLIARLERVPDALHVATQVLHDCPQIHLETALGQYAGVAELIRDQALSAAESAGLGDEIRPAADRALAGLADFDDWLRGRLSSASAGRSPRLGRRLWEAQLWHTLDTEMSASQLLDRAWTNLDLVSGQIRLAAAELLGGVVGGSAADLSGDPTALPGDPTVRAALDQLSADRPDDASIVAKARAALIETTEFVADHDLVSLVDDECQILVMPEFARGISVAYCDAPGPLEPANVPTSFAIAPTPASWSPERRESFYREYNNHMVRNLTVHEAMPGHFLQLTHSRRGRGSSRVRALCTSGSFVEGWAVYAEQLMAEAGYGGLPVRLQQLKMQLRSTINAILDQLVHCEDMTEADGMRLMTERGFQEAGEAAGKWRRALLTSGQLSTYFVGYSEMAEIGRQRPVEWGVREWHDAMLSHGSPAPRHLRTLLRGDEVDRIVG
ncbi:MAG: DUF885 domain-containing protein [Micromonosporaceae bacterium]